jgi:hypothetical protein
VDAATAAFARGDLAAAEGAIAKHLLAEPTDPVGLEAAGELVEVSTRHSLFPPAWALDGRALASNWTASIGALRGDAEPFLLDSPE